MSPPHHLASILRDGANKGLQRAAATTLSPAIHCSPTAPAVLFTAGILGHHQFHLRHIAGADGEVAPILLA